MIIVIRVFKAPGHKRTKSAKRPDVANPRALLCTVGACNHRVEVEEELAKGSDA